MDDNTLKHTFYVKNCQIFILVNKLKTLLLNAHRAITLYIQHRVTNWNMYYMLKYSVKSSEIRLKESLQTGSTQTKTWNQAQGYKIYCYKTLHIVRKQ